MSKTKKYTLTCRECKAQFQSVDPQVQICKKCIGKEQSKAVPKGPRPVDEQIK
jgi:rRNA maturation endonuclease Nob1